MAKTAIQQSIPLGQAMDIVDSYGPDPILWPYQQRDALEALSKADSVFADYIEEVREIEDMLGAWEWGDDDGASVGNPFGDEKSKPSSQDYDEDDEERSTPTGGGDDDTDDEDDTNDMPGIGVPMDTDKPVSVEDVPDFDPNDLKDMDEMVSAFIREQVQMSAPGEFRVFTRDFDELVDIKVPAGTSLDPIETAVAKSTGPLMKDLRRMIAAQTQSRRLPGRRSGRLHASSLHRVMTGDDRVFYRRENAPALDTAITLLMDNSGSMAGQRLKLATETAYAIATVLNKLGVAFECIGFTDNYSDARVRDKAYMKEVIAADAIAPIARHVPLTMPKFKTFEERWTGPVQQRFAHVFNKHGGHDAGIAMGSTPEGCGIEFAARRLLRRPEKRKLMLCMTDGEPGGHVFSNNVGYTIYRDQSARVVQSVAASGIDLVGVGIQHNGPADYYPHSIVINKLDDMPVQLLTILKKFMLA